MRNFQGIILTWTRTCSEIFKSALVYLQDNNEEMQFTVLTGYREFLKHGKKCLLQISQKNYLEEMQDTTDEQTFPLVLGSERIYQTENCWEWSNILYSFYQFGRVISWKRISVRLKWHIILAKYEFLSPWFRLCLFYYLVIR